MHPLSRRRAGVLCHVTSLPAAPGSSPLGDAAWRFLDFLHAARLHIWQVLPLNPPDSYGSPYQSCSLAALDAALLGGPAGIDPARLQRRLDASAAEFEAFCGHNRNWLDDYALFRVAQRAHQAPWWAWPEPLRRHDPDALARFAAHHEAEVNRHRGLQFLISEQWHRLRREAAARDVLLLGDMPLYPALASVDVWARQRYFRLDAAGRPLAVAGVPPDYFSETGQLWGNPLYDWHRLEADGFAWWLARVRRQLALFDVVRIDHFRGLEAYWSVPAGAATAIEGQWQPAPGRALLAHLAAAWPDRPLVAEDLGVITPEVERLRDDFELPGMRVLQFAFSGEPHNPHLPEAHPRHAVAYTGTHDNDTSLGWYGSLDADTRAQVAAYLGGVPDMPWPLIDAVYASAANSAIVPLQDYLGLDGRARMNTPGTVAGNWRWRLLPGQADAALARRIRARVESADRA